MRPVTTIKPAACPRCRSALWLAISNPTDRPLSRSDGHVTVELYCDLSRDPECGYNPILTVPLHQYLVDGGLIAPPRKET